MPTTFLPPELLSHIFELAHDVLQPSATSSFSLVCRSWLEPAQRTLFSDVSIPICSSKDTHLLHGAEEDVKRWEVFSNIRRYAPRRVALRGAGAHGGWLQKQSRELDWCQGVRDLTLADVWGSLDLLEDGNLRDLTKLTIQHSSLVSKHQALPSSLPPDLHHLSLHSSHALVPAFLHLFPHLHSLHISSETSFAECIGLDHVSSLPPLDSHLRTSAHLDLSPDPTPATRRTLHRFLSWLSPSSLSIYLSPTRPFETMINSIHSLPPSLRTLSFRRTSNCRNIAQGQVEFLFPIASVPFEIIGKLVRYGGATGLRKVVFEDCKREEVEAVEAGRVLMKDCEERGVHVYCSEEVV
ncbi:hypothetical protein P7C70_g3979, partial [Phenoliferia sp. Uapishka_3]